MKKALFLLSLLTLLLFLSTAFAAGLCPSCGSGSLTLEGIGSWCHWSCNDCGYAISRSHNPNSYNSALVPNSCTGRCSWCGAAALESSHSYSEWLPTGDATCLTDGTETSRCLNAQCTARRTRPAPGSALGHTYADTIYYPTCDTVGYTRHACIRCDEGKNVNPVEPKGHAWGTWTDNGDGAHSAACTRRSCRGEITAAHLPVTLHLGGEELSLCGLCGGGYGGEIAPATGELPDNLALLVDAAPLPLPEAFYLFVVTLQKDGAAAAPSAPMTLTVDLNAHPYALADSIFFESSPAELNSNALKLVRVEQSTVNGAPAEVWHELAFTLEGGLLTFETAETGLFLLVLNVAEAPSVG